MRTLTQDLRFGARMLLKAPGFTVIAVAALALGIGANTAIFSLVNAVLLKPLPFSEPERLVAVWEDLSSIGFPHNTPAAGNYSEWKRRNGVFTDIAALYTRDFNLVTTGDPEHLNAMMVTANLFPLLGVKPERGRLFLPDEDQPGAPRVAILSHELWQRRFGAAPDLVGNTIRLNGQEYVVTGIMPRGFQLGVQNSDNDVWAPAAFSTRSLANRDNHFLNVFARLKPGVTLPQAQSEMQRIARQMAAEYPVSNANVGAVVVPLKDVLVGDTRLPFLILLIAVACVLLIACANLANLLLARATGRQREVAVRTALGAGRLRMARQFLTESLLLSLAGGLVGVLLSVWTFDFLSKLIPGGVSQSAVLQLDFRVLAFTFLLSLATGLLFGAVPALQASRLDLNEGLKQGGRAGTAAGTHRLRAGLVVAEVAVAIVLVIAAALMIQTFAHLRHSDPGYRAQNVLTLRTVLPFPKYREPAARKTFYDQVLQRVQALPGVRSAAVTNFLPLTNRGGTSSFVIDGRPPTQNGMTRDANHRTISVAYFQTMGIPSRRGRYPDEHDGAQSTPVVFINEAMARQHFPAEDPLGKRIKMGRYQDPAPWWTIAGVVGDVKQMGLDVPSRSEMYFLYAQDTSWAPQDFAIRTAGDPGALTTAVRREIAAVDKEQAITNVQTLEDMLDLEVAQRRLQMFLLGGFASLALLLAALGIFGVLSYAVTQRTSEMGLRMAVGAGSSHVLAMVLRHGLRLSLTGAAVGVVAAFALTRLMSGVLYGVTPTDTKTFLLAPLLLTAVAAAATYFPARRATKVDPIVALRYE